MDPEDEVDSPPLPLPPLPDNERTEVLTAPQEKEIYEGDDCKQ